MIVIGIYLVNTIWSINHFPVQFVSMIFSKVVKWCDVNSTQTLLCEHPDQCEVKIMKKNILHFPKIRWRFATSFSKVMLCLVFLLASVLLWRWESLVLSVMMRWHNNELMVLMVHGSLLILISPGRYLLILTDNTKTPPQTKETSSLPEVLVTSQCQWCRMINM